MLEAAGIILSGGQNSRMRTNKAFLTVGQKRIIDRTVSLFKALFPQVIVVTNQPEAYAYLGVDLAQDRVRGMGPLSGMEAGLKASAYFYNFLVACDMPFINSKFVELLLEKARDEKGLTYDVVIPRMADGRLQPLYAVYSKNCLGPIRACLDAGISKILEFYAQVRVRYVAEADLACHGDVKVTFFNVNTPDDLVKAQAMAQGHAANRGHYQSPPGGQPQRQE